MPNLRAELGGMAYQSSQQLISCLVDVLGLGKDREPFPFGDPKTNRCYFRGRSFTQDMWSHPEFPNIYNLRPPELGKSTNDVFAMLAERIVKAAGFEVPRSMRE